MITEPVSKADELPTAQKLAQHPRWEWRAWMLLHQPGCSGAYRSRISVLDVTPDKIWCSHPELEHRFFFRPSSKGPGLYTCSLYYPMARALNDGAWAAALPLAPDLADDATGGIVLGMVRAWGEANDHRLSCVFLPAYHSDGPAPFAGVSVEHSEGVTRYIEGTGPTLGDAAGACLLASWARDAQGAGR